VSGNFYVGGLVGYDYLFYTVINSYATGYVSGTSLVGGLVGGCALIGFISNSFWDMETSDQSSSADGTGKTTSEMKDFSTFFNAGWDLICESDNGTDDIWGIDQSGADNNGYPFLSWQELTHNVSFTLAYSAGVGGTINGTSSQIVDCGSSGSAVEAIPYACYHFVSWSDSSTQNPRTDTSVKDDITVTANFAIDTFTLTYNPGTGGSVSGTTPQTVDCQSDGSAVTAVPDPCYYFVNWSDASTGNPRTDTDVTGDITVTANFAPTGATYNLTINSSEYGNVSIPGEGPSGPYACGSSVNLSAIADSCCGFVNWTGDIDSIANPNAASTTILMNGSKTIQANFIVTPWDVNCEGAINVLDMILIGQHWGQTGAPGWIPEDVNGDGTVNVLDMILVGQHWTG